MGKLVRVRYAHGQKLTISQDTYINSSVNKTEKLFSLQTTSRTGRTRGTGETGEMEFGQVLSNLDRFDPI